MSLLLLLRTNQAATGAIHGTGSVSIAGPTLAGTGSVGAAPAVATPVFGRRGRRLTVHYQAPPVHGTGHVSIAGPTVAGRGRIGVAGAGAVAIGGPALEGEGRLGVRGAGAIAAPAVRLAATGNVNPFARAQREDEQWLELEDGDTIAA